MSWEKQRMNVFREHIDIAASKKTPLQRRKYIIKAVNDEFKDMCYELKGSKWATQCKKDGGHLIYDLQDALNDVDTKKAFDAEIINYVKQSSRLMDQKAMHYRYETSSTDSESEYSESEESASDESASEESESRSEEYDDSDDSVQESSESESLSDESEQD